MLPRVALPVSFCLLTVAGCVKVTGGFQPNGFGESDIPVAVRYRDAATHTFVGPEWRVDNFKVKANGTFGDAKEAPEYLYDREIDVDGDGKPETDKAPVYELKLVNRVTTAAIWLQTPMLALQDKDRSLKSFVDDFVEGLSGTGIYRVGTTIPKRVGAAKTYGARVVDSKEGRIGGFASLDVTIELVNLDQLKVDPSAKSAIGRVVFVRTNYSRPYAKVDTHNTYETRVMVVLGCESNPRDFDTTNADFEKFLASVDLGPAPAR
jgi:hypothetical protein